MAPSKDKWVRRFVINETTRHKNGFTIYRVTSMIYLKTHPDVVSKVSIWKRYSDFQKLHASVKLLHTKYHIKETFPTFAKPKFFGRFAVEVIEERRKCAIQFLEFIARHTSLFTSDVFVKFFDTSHMEDYLGLDGSMSISSDTSEDDKIINKLPEAEYEHLDSVEESSVKTDDEAQLPSTSTEDFVDFATRKESFSWDIHDGSDLPDKGDCTQYILIAAAHMSAAFKHEAIAEHQEAFVQYKLGISSLLQGMDTDPDETRVQVVRNKVSKYLERAEKLYHRHLSCNISLFGKPVAYLKNYKVVRIMGSVLLVREVASQNLSVIKTVEKIGSRDDISKYILRGRIPYMVQLQAYVETDSSIFLILEYISGGKLWDYLKRTYRPSKKSSFRKQRSSSCDAIIQKELINENIVKLEENRVETIDTKESEEYYLPTEESIKRLEDEFGANSLYNRDLTTSELLQNAQKLLESVNVTLRESDDVANRLSTPKRTTIDSIQNQHLVNNSNTELNCNFTSTIDQAKLSNFDNNKLESLNNIEISSNSSDSEDENSVVKSFVWSNSKDCSTDRSRVSRQLSDEEEFFSDKTWQLTEDKVRNYAAEILLCLEALHQRDLIVATLNPDNILVDDEGRVAVTYMTPRTQNLMLGTVAKSYASPELTMFSPMATPTCLDDIWSFGALLYELFTGTSFQSKHPGVFHSHSALYIPKGLTEEAKSLLIDILRYQPHERLTILDIKQHPFFKDVPWTSLMNS